MENEKDFLQQRINIDTEGTNSEDIKRPLLPEGEKVLEVVEVGAAMMKSFNDPMKKEPKIFVNFISGSDIVSAIISPTIHKGGGTYSNSKMYDVLIKLNLLDKAKSELSGSTIQGLVDFLGRELVGKKIRVLIGTTKKATSPYSKIEKIYGFA